LNSESEDEEMADDGEEFQGFDGDKEGQNEIVKQLEEQASMGAPPAERKQSDREKEWIEGLVGKYGDDYIKMSRDRRLNPFQQTPADIKRRVGKWRAKGGEVSVET
jgi:nucleolar protein 16